ncbi:MAG: hypothetical protein BM564_00770 [Bacteroidetes bacterium MedPE-SWsnd-G2]|nr:MAG: hypothetical protein BM564_00770 [Bacteroidetes bacterium MedPE-SWsnd-G2]
MRIVLFLLCVLFIFSCEKQVDYYLYPAFSGENRLNAVIEIPAGTNRKIEYNSKTFSFEIDKIDGEDRVINYLPYLGNYGFVPSTFSDPKLGGDGDAIDIIVLAESVATGTVIETIPIAILKLLDDGEIDYKIVAIPSDISKQIVSVENFSEFDVKFPEIKGIIETWFLNYNTKDDAIIEGWGDEKEAVREIMKNLKQ